MNGGKFSVNIFNFIILFFLVRLSVQTDESKDLGKTPEEPSAEARIHSEFSHTHQRSDSKSEASKEKEEDEERANEVTNQIQILEQGDPYTFLLVDNATGCLYVTEDDIPDTQKGLQSFRENCEPGPLEPFDASSKCKLYTKSMNDSECLKPTHFLCDPVLKKCVCGNEDNIIPDVRFQVGDKFGKDHKNGKCYIRPTFDWLPGFECAPGSEIKPVTAGEDSDPINICKCIWDDEYDHEKFDSTDNEWWKCSSKAASLIRSMWQIILIGGTTTVRYPLY